MVTELIEAQKQAELTRVRNRWTRYDLIVIDEVNNALNFERHENASSDYLNLRQNNYIE